MLKFIDQYIISILSFLSKFHHFFGEEKDHSWLKCVFERKTSPFLGGKDGSIKTGRLWTVSML